MTAWKPHKVWQIFAGLVPDEVAAAYEKLLEADSVPKRDAGAFFDDDDAVETLTSFGMATVYGRVRGKGPIVHPVDPDLAIQGVLNTIQAQALDLQQLLAEGTRRAIEAHGMHRCGPNGYLAEILTDRQEIIDASGALINDARRDFMELDNLNRDTPISEDMLIGTPGLLEGRITHRAIYDREFTQDDAGRKFIAQCTAAGQQIRWRPEIRAKMQIADTSTALIALTLTGMGGALLIRSEPTVSALREYFEVLWDSAIPVSGPAPDHDALTPSQREVLDLLGAGLSQDRIAERLGKSPATVRRHLNTIYRELGVTTLYQAGVAAHRKGWAA